MDPAALVPLGALLAGGGVGALALRAEHARTAALSALAAERGWQVQARDDAFATAFEGEPFGEGTHRRATGVLLGAHAGRDVVAFDYAFRTRGGDGEPRTRRYGVVAVALPVPLPLVEVVPSRLPGGLQLESADFNRRFRVRAQDPRLASDVLGPRTVQLLLDLPPVPLRLAGGTALAWDRGRLTATAVRERLDVLTAVLDGVPSFVWADRA